MIHKTPLEPSLWFATAAAAPETTALDGTIDAPVCVIGAGYTGLSTALHLGERGVGAVVLEAEQIGHGGSGRNAGHCTPTFHVHEIPTIRRILGEPFASRLIERQTNAANLVFDIIRRYGIDCEAVQTGYIHAAHASSALAKLEQRCRDYAAIGKATRMLGRDEAQRLTGSPRFCGGWFHPEGGHLNPLGYARGLARAAMSRGARVFTRSPATAIRPQGGRWRVETPTGAVIADKVVCGTGAYTDGFWPGLEQSFARLGVAVLATQPLGDNVRRTIAPDNNTVVDSRRDISIWKYDKDGRLVTSLFVEGRRGRDPTYTRDLMRRKLQWLLPQLGDIEFQYRWSGALDMQPRTFPRLYGLAPGIVASLGYSGRGVPTGTMMGTVLAEWATGTPPKDLALPLEKLQRAPFYMSFMPRVMLAWSRIRDQRLARRDGLDPPPF
ncbi:FAD-binding oxidoreductase [Inquilinus limosus]|uniref:NAD(P)/FAD-dependent oxidoreductase n=1 Tax=Inquilinus limosus TaxID=171674 RepID=UPI003F163268